MNQPVSKAQMLFLGHLRKDTQSVAKEGAQTMQKQGYDVLEICFDSCVVVQGVHVVPQGVAPHPELPTDFVGASFPAVFDVELCARDVSQPDAIVLRPLLQPIQVHGGTNTVVPPESQLPTNYITVSGTFDAVSLILYGYVVLPEHVSPAMAMAMGDNPPVLPDEQQLLSDLEGTGPDGDDLDDVVTDAELSAFEWLRSPVDRVLESAKLQQPSLMELCEVSLPASRHFQVSHEQAQHVISYVADKSVAVLGVMPAVQCHEMFRGLSQLLNACWKVDDQSATMQSFRAPITAVFPEVVCYHLKSITLWALGHLSDLDKHDDLSADERVQAYLNCGLAGLELSEMLLVNEHTAAALTADGEWLRAVLRPLKTQSLPRHGVDKVLHCLFLCTQHYSLLRELFGNVHTQGLSVYEIVVQEMAERTLRGEIAELGRHILQKAALLRTLSDIRRMLTNCQRVLRKYRRQKRWEVDIAIRCRELDDVLRNFSAIFLATVRDTRAKALRQLRNASVVEQFFRNDWSDRCLAQLLIQAELPHLLAGCAAVVETAGVLFGTFTAMVSNDADLCAILGLKKALSRALSVLSMLPMERFAPQCGEAFEVLLRCVAHDPAKLILTTAFPNRVQAVAPDFQPTCSIEQHAARLLLDAISHKHRLLVVQAAVTGDRSRVAGCVYALQILRDMLSFPNGRAAVAAAMDVKFIQSIAWLFGTQFCGAVCAPYLGALCQVAFTAPSAAFSHAALQNPNIVRQLLQAHPASHVDNLLTVIEASSTQQGTSLPLVATISAMFQSQWQQVMEAFAEHDKPGALSRHVDVRPLTFAVLAVVELLPNDAEARQLFAEHMLVPCLALGNKLSDAMLWRCFQTGNPSRVLHELAQGAPVTTDDGDGDDGLELQLQLMAALMQAALTICSVAMRGQQPLPLLDSLVEFSLKVYQFGFHSSHSDMQPCGILAKGLMANAMSVLKMMCPPSPMAAMAMIIPRIATEAMTNIAARPAMLQLVSSLLPSGSALVRAADIMDHTLLSQSLQLAELHEKELRDRFDHIRVDWKSKALEPAVVGRDESTPSFRRTQTPSSVVDMLQSEVDIALAAMDPLLSEAIQQRQDLSALVMLGALSASSAGVLSTVQLLYKSLSLSAELFQQLSSPVVQLLQRYADAVISGEPTSRSDICGPVMDRLAFIVMLLSRHSCGALGLLTVGVGSAVVAVCRSASEPGCFFALQTLCNLLAAMTKHEFSESSESKAQRLHAMAAVSCHLATTLLIRWRSSSRLVVLGCWELLHCAMRTAPTLTGSMVQHLTSSLHRQSTTLPESLRDLVSGFEQSVSAGQCKDALCSVSTAREILDCVVAAGPEFSQQLRGTGTQFAQFVEGIANCLDCARAALHSTAQLDTSVKELLEFELMLCDEHYVSISKVQERSNAGTAISQLPPVTDADLRLGVEVFNVMDEYMWKNRDVGAGDEIQAISLDKFLSSWWLLEPIDPSHLHLAKQMMQRLYDSPMRELCGLAKQAVLDIRGGDRKRQKV